MPTLILTPRMTEDSIALWRAANRRGWAVERMMRFRPPEDFIVEGEAVLFVEALTAPLFAEALGLVLEEAPVDWLPKLPPEYRSRDISLTTLGEARRLSGRHFIKPPNDKSFTAAVYGGSELPDYVPDDAPVLVSSIVSWEVEFRCFVLDRKVQTFSAYLRNGVLQREAEFPYSEHEASQLLEFMGRLLGDSRVVLPRAVVIDAGMIRDGGWAVVEANAAWASGIYGCDPEGVLDVLRHAVSRVEGNGSARG